MYTWDDGIAVDMTGPKPGAKYDVRGVWSKADRDSHWPQAGDRLICVDRKTGQEYHIRRDDLDFAGH